MERKVLKYKDFSNKKRMDAVKSDKFEGSSKKEEHLQLLNTSQKNRILLNNKIESKKPEHLGPKDRANELLKIKGFIQSIGEKQAKSDAERYDHGMTKKFKKLCGRLGVDFDTKYFSLLKEESKVFGLREKYRWNIPRPEQTAKLLKIPFSERYETESSNSPSYPSNHSLQSNLFAEILSKLYPEHRQEFFRLANLISLSRMSAGVHYMADIKEGKRLANVLMETGKIKLPG